MGFWLLAITTWSIAAEPASIPNTNRPGATYKTSTLFFSDPEVCRKACMADKKCKAWTFKKRGTRLQGYKPQCLLKDSVPKAVRSQCCVSGVKNVVYVPNKNVIIGRGVIKPVLTAPTAKIVKPRQPKAPVRRANTPATRSLAKPNSGLAVIVPKTSINPAVAGMFEQLSAKRNAAIREAAAQARERQDALAEMRRRASANDPSQFIKLDCDDNDPGVHPNQNEVCNFKDDNCDGIVDEGVTLTVYRDADGDGFGDPAQQVQACAAGSGLAGMSLNATDCDDTDARRNPATGTCG